MIIDTIDNNIYIIVKLLILCFLVSVVVLFFIISLLILNPDVKLSNVIGATPVINILIV